MRREQSGAMRVLILGGTWEARALAARLVAAGHDVTTSLAGVTRAPELPPGRVRRGGFGGAEGLADYIQRERFEAVIDATHPFAAQISAHAATAAHATGIPSLRFERPAWQRNPQDRWIDVLSVAEAVAALPHGARVLLTIGRKEIAPFLARGDLAGIVRAIEIPKLEMPAGWRLLTARPPFSFESERELMARERVTHLVSKNAGGDEMRAKLDAARALGLPVVMIARPAKPEAPCVASLADAERWLAGLAG
jgi:precorrin-6A/cobalt-precorrin-6A reductase